MIIGHWSLEISCDSWYLYRWDYSWWSMIKGYDWLWYLWYWKLPLCLSPLHDTQIYVLYILMLTYCCLIMWYLFTHITLQWHLIIILSWDTDVTVILGTSFLWILYQTIAICNKKLCKALKICPSTITVNYLLDVTIPRISLKFLPRIPYYIKLFIWHEMNEYSFILYITLCYY